ncbi:MAG: hypothetical protein Kow0081_4850 [Candidatus Dojkabacteria bacterium]
MCSRPRYTKYIKFFTWIFMRAYGCFEDSIAGLITYVVVGRPFVFGLKKGRSFASAFLILCYRYFYFIGYLKCHLDLSY